MQPLATPVLKEFEKPHEPRTIHDRHYQTGKCFVCNRFRWLPDGVRCNKHMESIAPVIEAPVTPDTVSGGVHYLLGLAKQSDLMEGAERMIQLVMDKAMDLHLPEEESRISIFVSVRKGYDLRPDGSLHFTGDLTKSPVIEHVPYVAL